MRFAGAVEIPLRVSRTASADSAGWAKVVGGAGMLNTLIDGESVCELPSMVTDVVGVIGGGGAGDDDGAEGIWEGTAWEAYPLDAEERACR